MAIDIKLKQEKRLVNSFKALATAYQEISIYKMRLSRASILANRIFLEELSEIFFDVRMSYLNILELLLRHHRKEGLKQFAGISKNGKQIDVLVTANTKLYGSIVGRVFDQFYKDVSNHESDLFIIGRIGRSLFDAKKTNRKYAYFEIPDNDSTSELLAPIITHLLPYEKVVVYYGKFVNIISQAASNISISGDESLENKEQETHEFKFLFEPHLEEILHFFQTQVFTSLFNQSVHEGELARHASRVVSMEDALKNIEETLKKLNIKLFRMKTTLTNKKQLQQLSGMSLWEEEAYA